MCRPEQAERSSGKYQFSAGIALRLFGPTICLQHDMLSLPGSAWECPVRGSASMRPAGGAGYTVRYQASLGTRAQSEQGIFKQPLEVQTVDGRGGNKSKGRSLIPASWKPHQSQRGPRLRSLRRSLPLTAA
jgi:hypothetical protein